MFHIIRQHPFPSRLSFPIGFTTPILLDSSLILDYHYLNLNFTFIPPKTHVFIHFVSHFK